MGTEIDFVTDCHEYTVKQFYECYRDSLPQLAVVTQGYLGEIGIETFGRGQALRIFAYYRQKRVMASVYHEVGRTTLDKTLLSIPLDGDTKFHLTNPGKQDMTEYTLSQLLESGENKHTLPIDIQFADEVQAKSVGMAFREIDKTLHIRIFEQFDEIFLLGNPLWRGCVYSKVIEIPVYLPKMTMAVATGIKGYDAETWRRYKSEMRDSIEKNTQVDVRYGRKDIAVYSTDVLHTYNSYTFLPPLSYIKIGPDESRCCLSLSLDCIFEPLFLTDEQKELKKENNGITNVKTDKSGQEYNIPCVEKLKLSKDKSESGKQTGQQNDERYSESENSLKEKGIEFDYPQEGMTVKEFYDRFKDQLPKVVLITEGYHGETGIESFGRGQIIRIHTIFKQQRVKAELVHGRGTNPEDYHISIPLDYKANFYEVKHIEFPKPKEKSLSEILKKHKIRHHPEVKFAKLEESLILHLDSKNTKIFYKYSPKTFRRV
ncbi:hypothetical protein KUTeg_000233 [Tegillarca granosa]|uniref:Uncharacterized protein n=1 Tax=Tegillarca granosa TaxID=220873 RepID=A0ABQ9G0E5_TEGGR|nr:hypothetical protein KUTeg_000233 [Tegillarca granosa]